MTPPSNNPSPKPVKAWAIWHAYSGIDPNMVRSDKPNFCVPKICEWIEVEIRRVSSSQELDNKKNISFQEALNILKNPPTTDELDYWHKKCSTLESQLEESRREHKLDKDRADQLEDLYIDAQKKLSIARAALSRIKEAPVVSWVMDIAKEALHSIDSEQEKDLGIKDTLKAQESIASPTPLQTGSRNSTTVKFMTDDEIERISKVILEKHGELLRKLSESEQIENLTKENEELKNHTSCCECGYVKGHKRDCQYASKPTDYAMSANEECFPSKDQPVPYHSFYSGIIKKLEEENEELSKNQSTPQFVEEYLAGKKHIESLEHQVKTMREKFQMIASEKWDYMYMVNIARSGLELSQPSQEGPATITEKMLQGINDYALKEMTKEAVSEPIISREASAEEALEWLAHSDCVVTSVKNGTFYSVYTTDDLDVEWKGSTPLEAIRNAMRAQPQHKEKDGE